MAQITELPQQPQIPAEFILLDREYIWGDVLVDLYGEFDCDGRNVCAVALAGTKIDLTAFFGYDALNLLSMRCDAVLQSWEDIKLAESIAAARATRERVAA